LLSQTFHREKLEIRGLARKPGLLYRSGIMVKESAKVLIVFTTVGKRSDALRMSRTVVKLRKVAACATILPAISIYRWKGKIIHEREVLIMFKTTNEKYPALEKAIKALHAYEIPEILALAVSSGYSPYLGWVTSEVSD